LLASGDLVQHNGLPATIIVTITAKNSCATTKTTTNLKDV
jgi:hypothetical protein